MERTDGGITAPRGFQAASAAAADAGPASRPHPESMVSSSAAASINESIFFMLASMV